MRDSCSRTAVAGTGSAGESPADFTGKEDGIGDDLNYRAFTKLSSAGQRRVTRSLRQLTAVGGLH
jgi:hypothetical protein